MIRLVKIAIVNACTVVPDAHLASLTDALQTQLDRDVSPVWGFDAKLTFVPHGQKPPRGYWWVVWLDNADVANALGYHDLTTDLLPIGKVFAKTAADAGDDPDVTGSHELVEMACDPDLSRVVVIESDAHRGRAYALEPADPVEDDRYAYPIPSSTGALHKVSNFVWPSWYGGFRAMGQLQFDQRHVVNAPFELAPGGYVSFLDFRTSSGWQQQFAQDAPKAYRMRPPIGSRRERRRTPRELWKASTV